MKYLLIFLLLPFSALADEKYCTSLADIVFTQAIGKPYIEESMKDSGIETWRMMWFVGAEDFDSLGVKEKRQKKIAKEITKAKSISDNPDVDAFLISDFYYTFCITPKKDRKYKSLLKVKKDELLSCWDKRDKSKEHGSRECIVVVSTKP